MTALLVAASAAQAADGRLPASSSQAAQKQSEPVFLPPIQRLKQRSPEKRWQEQAGAWLKERRTAGKAQSGKTNRSPRPQPKPKSGPAKSGKVAGVAPPKRTNSRTAPPFPDNATLLPASVVKKTWSQYVAYQKESDLTRYPEPVRDPKKLKKVTEIQPYYDYEPDPESLGGDRCKNLCPRPGSPPCPPSEEKATPTCPEEVALSQEPYEGRTFPDQVFSWAASNLYHNPLYFQDVPLERYGHTHGDVIQPFVSVGKFGVQLLGLPYAMTIDPVRKKMYTLGWYQPGECAPKKYYQIPWNLEAALRTGAVWTGLVFLFP